jgi:hypothetical protein
VALCRHSTCAIELLGRLYVFGGTNTEGERISSVESFGPTSLDTWSDGRDQQNRARPAESWRMEAWMPASLRSHAVAQCGDLLYIVGGFGCMSDTQDSNENSDSDQEADSMAPNVTAPAEPHVGSMNSVFMCPVDR